VKPIIFDPAAAQEARDAARWYEQEKEGLGIEFQAELRAALARIQDNPQLYAAEQGAIRLCPLHRFSYSIYYAELGGEIWIAAVGHNHRRPRYWANRRPR
jgi:plasmid stabilization system protein ParE